MLIDLCSDLHCDKWGGTASVDWSVWKNSGSSVLIIGGDISNDYRETLEILRNARNHYEIVIFVDGNHDHYYLNMVMNVSIDAAMMLFREECAAMGVHYHDGASPILVGDVLFTGCNGWYDFAFGAGTYYTAALAKEAWRGKFVDCPETGTKVRVGGSGDYYMNFGSQGPEFFAAAQAFALGEIVRAVQNDQAVRKIVCSTHSAPDPRCLSWRKNDPANGMYGNSHMATVRALDVNNKIALWTFGHTHTRFDSVINGMRCVCHPRGNATETGDIGSDRLEEYRVVQIDTEEPLCYSAFGEIE